MTVIPGEKIDADLEDILRDKFLRTELAIDTIATMLGFNSTERIAEEKKNIRDLEYLKNLCAEERKLSKEQREIYSGTVEVQKACIINYCPVIRKHRGSE